MNVPACPICGKHAEPAHRPFCSARCRQIDLGRWLNGAYAIPAEPSAPENLPDEGEENEAN